MVGNIASNIWKQEQQVQVTVIGKSQQLLLQSTARGKPFFIPIRD